MTKEHLDTGPSSIRDDSICESSLPPNKSSGDIGELKPCPFCQSEGHTLLRGFRYADECPDRKELAVMCPTCEARAPLKAWNTRTPDPESAAEIERLRRDCAELYQVIGTLASAHVDIFDHPQVVKALDNASAAANGDPRPHDDLLPFTPIKIDDPLLTAESAVAAAMEVLKPFADASEHFGEGAPDDFDIWDSSAATAITVGDLRRASAIRAAVLEKTAESGHSTSTHNSESE